MRDLLSALIQYREEGRVPFHMPGHKRNTALYHLPDPVSIDITEIEGFDNLQHPEGILLRCEKRLSALYRSRASFVLTNGSTGGIHAALALLLSPGDSFLMARNSHKAAYHACQLQDLRPIYLYPESYEDTALAGPISPEAISRALELHPEAKCLYVTSPTYEGVVSPILELAEIAHRHGIPLVVDEAHGAHLSFCTDKREDAYIERDLAFPPSSLTQGADIVVQSLHKTLPSLTQTAVLHLGPTAADFGISPERMRQFLNCVQSTSPSYVLMAGVDRCVSILIEQGKQLVSDYKTRLARFYEEMGDLKRIRLLRGRNRDPGKLVFFLDRAGISGTQATAFLRDRFSLELEMEGADFCLAMTSLCDSEEAFVCLRDGMYALDAVCDTGETIERVRESTASCRQERRDALPFAKSVLPLSRAARMEGKALPIFETEGKISLEYVYFYPPGIPLLAPGELVSGEVLSLLRDAAARGLPLYGMKKKGYLETVQAQEFLKERGIHRADCQSGQNTTGETL